MKKNLNQKITVDEMLADIISLYLMETNKTITDWDCDHLAMNLLEKGLINEKALEPTDWKKWYQILFNQVQKVINKK